MEHQDSVTWPFLGIIAAYCAFVVGLSIYHHGAGVLLWGFGLLLAAAVMWGLVALLNIAIFAPVFRLLAMLTGKQKPDSHDNHDRVA
jgi:riboflavin transporter FmnP